MNRLFICGITSNEYVKINDLILATKDYVDGYVWCVDSNWNSDSTYQLLENNKKEGKIVRHPWICAHDWQANEWLYCGALKKGDWIWMFDSSEQPTNKWLSEIRNNMEYCDNNQICAFYASNRPYLFKYSEYLYFLGTPHWGIYGLEGGKAVVLSDENKKELIINNRDLNPSKHYQEHDTKYYLYGRSNIIDAFYGRYGQEKVNFHEALRRQFRGYLRDNFSEVNLKTLDNLFSMRTEDWQDKGYVADMVDIEFCLSEYYRRTILKEDFMKDIVPKREQWSFKHHLEFGNGFANPEYLGTRLKYDKEAQKNQEILAR